MTGDEQHKETNESAAETNGATNPHTAGGATDAGNDDPTEIVGGEASGTIGETPDDCSPGGEAVAETNDTGNSAAAEAVGEAEGAAEGVAPGGEVGAPTGVTTDPEGGEAGDGTGAATQVLATPAEPVAATGGTGVTAERAADGGGGGGNDAGRGVAGGNGEDGDGPVDLRTLRPAGPPRGDGKGTPTGVGKRTPLDNDRRWIAQMLLWILASVIILYVLFVGFYSYLAWADKTAGAVEKADAILKMISQTFTGQMFTALVGLVGSVVGFYFGSEKSNS